MWADRVYYHTGGDNPANLDPRTVQHQGDNALALARHLGGLDLDLPSGEDVIYTSILGWIVLAYPQYWSMPIAIAVAVVFMAVVVVGLWSGRVTAADLGMGILTWLIAAVASVFFAQAFWVVLRDIMVGLGLVWMQFDVLIMTLCSLVAAAVTLAVEPHGAKTIARRAGAGSPGVVAGPRARHSLVATQFELSRSPGRRGLH